MTLLVLLRHFPTEDDVQNVYTPRHAQPSFAAFPEGSLQRLQAELTEFFLRHRLRYIYCSANSRGIDTATMISAGLQCDHEIRVDGRLDNIEHPEWDGLSQDVVKSTTIYDVWHSRPTDAVFTNGESLLTVGQRVDAFLKNIDPAGGLIVSHTVPMQIILCRMLGVDLSRIWAFKFDHWRVCVILDDILLRYNSFVVNDIAFGELRR